MCVSSAIRTCRSGGLCLQRVEGGGYSGQSCATFVLVGRAAGVGWSQRLSAVDNIHQIAGRIAEKESAQSPLFGNGPIDHFRPHGANGGLGRVKIVHAN